MTALTSLWLPLLVSTVLVFIVSSVIHMLPLWHKSDYPALPDQNGFLDAVRPLTLPPGDYMVPRASSMAEMRSPEFTQKMQSGPVMIVTVIPPGPIGMGRALALWFVYCGVVNYFAAYVASRALAPGAEYLDVFRFVGTTAFVGYALALWQMSIWYRRSWGMTIIATWDGLIYALVAAGAFGWLWPR